MISFEKQGLVLRAVLEATSSFGQMEGYLSIGKPSGYREGEYCSAEAAYLSE